MHKQWWPKPAFGPFHALLRDFAFPALTLSHPLRGSSQTAWHSEEMREESCAGEKDLIVLVNAHLNMSQQHSPGGQEGQLHPEYQE